MSHQTKNEIEILQSRIAVVYGFLAFASFCPYSCTVALCVVGGFSILEANMSQFILSVLDLIQDQANDELKLQTSDCEVSYV